MRAIRGVVVVGITLRDAYGNQIPGKKLLKTKTYSKEGVARGQATLLANNHKNVLDKYIEEAVEWSRID